MEKNPVQTLNSISRFIIGALIFTIPIFFLPITVDFYDFNKQAFLVIGVSAVLLLWLGTMVLNRRVRFVKTPFDLPLIFLGLSYILSTFIQNPSKTQALITPNNTTTVIALIVLYFLITNLFAKKEKADVQQLVEHVVTTKKTYAFRLFNIFLFGASIISLIAIYQFLEVGTQIAPYEWMKSKSWSPTGEPLSTILFLALILPIGIYNLLIKKDKEKLPVLYLLADLLMIGAFIIVLYQLFTDSKPLILPFAAGWSIAIDTLRNFHQALLGVGPANFLAAFTSAKPLFLNNTNIWNVLFTNSSNHYFQILTEVGVIGFVAFLLLILAVIKSVKIKGKKGDDFGLRLSLIFAAVIFLLVPVNFVFLFTFVVILAIFASQNIAGELTETSQVLPWLFFIPAILIVAYTLYSGGKAYAAEVVFRNSLQAATENKGQETYDLQIRAIQLNPSLPNYHVAYSQTNMALANVLSQKSDLNDQDKNNITLLIQQAIREGKTAVSLNPTWVTNWENLANIYRNLINAAPGADQWTIATYNQAIVLDPLNPNLRISLGGVFYSLKDYDSAIEQFKIAANLKPDLANAHYNLAAAYREKKDYQRAAIEMQTALSLVPADSNDYQKANEELEQLKKLLPPEQAATISGEPETLTQPQPPITGVPQISLPPEVAPEISPMVTPTISEETQPTEAFPTGLTPPQE